MVDKPYVDLTRICTTPPIIKKLRSKGVEYLNGIANQVWYADNSAAGSTVVNIRRWWDVLVEIGSLYRYYPNSSKTHILTKPEHVESAFKDTDITVSTNGKGYLGGAIGSTPFVKFFMEKMAQ